MKQLQKQLHEPKLVQIEKKGENFDQKSAELQEKVHQTGETWIFASGFMKLWKRCGLHKYEYWCTSRNLFQNIIRQSQATGVFCTRTHPLHGSFKFHPLIHASLKEQSVTRQPKLQLNPPPLHPPVGLLSGGDEWRGLSSGWRSTWVYNTDWSKLHINVLVTDCTKITV